MQYIAILSTIFFVVSLLLFSKLCSHFFKVVRMEAQGEPINAGAKIMSYGFVKLLYGVYMCQCVLRGVLLYCNNFKPWLWSE